jgi:hypothetical protein
MRLDAHFLRAPHELTQLELGEANIEESILDVKVSPGRVPQLVSLRIEQRDHGTATWTNSFHTPSTTDIQLASPLASPTRCLNQQRLGIGRII